jgi:hypothetical protein
MRARFRLALGLVSLLVLIAFGSAGDQPGAAARGTAPLAIVAHWSPYVRIPTVVDLVGPLPDGSMVVASSTKLSLLHPSGAVTPYAPGYTGPGGEPYIALVPPNQPGCSFGAGTVYALRPVSPVGVIAIAPSGQVRQFARITAPGLLNGITFDTTGSFGGRLLVTVNAGSTTTVDAIDCHGNVAAVTSHAPRLEGGIAVAPPGFGRFAGDLIAADEFSGTIFAITPGGQTAALAASGLPHGKDIGVEGVGFVPAGKVEALFADRLVPGNPHPGDGVVLRLPLAALQIVGVRAGDLLVASEGGALTDAIRCTASGCQVRFVADGPSQAHGEGHVAFR